MSRGGRVARVAVAGLLALAPAPALAQARVVEATLGNGLRVLLEEDHRSPVVALQLWYRVGSRNETVGKSGLSHYLEHMMFKGTPRFGPGVYSRRVEEQGGDENAYTGRDSTVYHVTVAADRIDAVLDLEADRMRNLLLAPREVESERKVVMEERRTRTEDDPVGALGEEFASVAFVAHSYRLPPIGFMSDIERLSARDLRAWYDRYYRPNNAILVAVGDFRAPEMLRKVQARFGPVPRGPVPPPVTITEPAQRGERRVWVKREARLAVVYAGYHTPNWASPDAYPLEVLSTILSSGRASRLYRRLVYEERLALDAGGDYTLLTVDPDAFTFYATALPDKRIEDVERVLTEEIERLRTAPVSDEELQRAKNQMEAAFLFGQDSAFARASVLARHERVSSWRLRDEYLPRIRGVTAEDLRRVAARYFVEDGRTTAILVPVPPAADAPAR